MQLAVVLEQCLAPVPGGTGRYSREVARALGARDDVRVTGWTAWHRDVEPARVPGVRGPERLPLGRRPLVLAWERGRGPVPRGRGPVWAPTLLVPPVRGRPLVVTIHDAVPWTHPETLTPRGVRWHRVMAERAAAAADVVTVPTAAVEVELRAHLRLGRVEVVGGGVTEDVVRGPRPPATGAPGYLVSLATTEPRKGLDVLVEALARPGAPDVPLLVVGQPGWGGVDPLALARGHGLRDGQVQVLGRVSDARLAEVLAGALALVVPSRAEGFGLPVVEAMAAGVPVVVSDVPALREVGGSAVVTAPVGDPAGLADALRTVVADGALREQMVHRGLVEARRHTWSGAAERMAAVLAELER